MAWTEVVSMVTLGSTSGSGAPINIDGITKKFRLANGRELVVFDEFSLDIKAGEFVAVLGSSGCGKTTFLRMLAGLDTLDQGRIVFGDPPESRRPRVGLMLQQYPSLPWLTVGENVEVALSSGNRATNGSRARERALYYLSRVGLVGWERSYPRELSGGMAQRLALARTLAMEPDVVLLDEPLSSLDALTRQDLQCLIRDLHQQERRTFVMVTHDVDEAVAMADRVIVLGPAGAGILYDSAQSKQRLDRDGLVRLLRGTHLTFAAGTWSGYSIVRQAAMENGTRVYDFWLGLSDKDRCAALRSGRVAGAFFTIPALVQVFEELTDLEPVVVHAFSRPATQTACERLVIRRSSRAATQLRWAIPGRGLEKALVERLDPNAFPNRIVEHPDRAACISAVARGEVDACIADERFVRELVPRRHLQQLDLRLLPGDLWPDLWTVLVTSRKLLQEMRESLTFGLSALIGDVVSVNVESAHEVEYLDARASMTVLGNGSVDAAFKRWRGAKLPTDLSILDDNATSPK